MSLGSTVYQASRIPGNIIAAGLGLRGSSVRASPFSSFPFSFILVRLYYATLFFSPRDVHLPLFCNPSFFFLPVCSSSHFVFLFPPLLPGTSLVLFWLGFPLTLPHPRSFGSSWISSRPGFSFCDIDCLPYLRTALSLSISRYLFSSSASLSYCLISSLSIALSLSLSFAPLAHYRGCLSLSCVYCRVEEVVFFPFLWRWIC